VIEVTAVGPASIDSGFCVLIESYSKVRVGKFSVLGSGERKPDGGGEFDVTSFRKSGLLAKVPKLLCTTTIHHSSANQAPMELVGPKIKLNRVAYFSSTIYMVFSVHNHHAFHHDFTSKLPSKKPRFLKTPFKNAHKTTKIFPHHPQNFFCQI
jgi:hypothetical protein